MAQPNGNIPLLCPGTYKVLNDEAVVGASVKTGCVRIILCCASGWTHTYDVLPIGTAVVPLDGWELF